MGSWAADICPPPPHTPTSDNGIPLIYHWIIHAIILSPFNRYHLRACTWKPANGLPFPFLSGADTTITVNYHITISCALYNVYFNVTHTHCILFYISHFASLIYTSSYVFGIFIVNHPLGKVDWKLGWKRYYFPVYHSSANNIIDSRVSFFFLKRKRKKCFSNSNTNYPTPLRIKLTLAFASISE